MRVDDLAVPARQASLRERNLALVLREVAAAAEPVSRAGLAARTGLTKATVSALVEILVAGGLVEEVAAAPRAGAGRPATGLRTARSGPAGLGLEVNVDYAAACVLDLHGTVRHREVQVGDLRALQPRHALGRVARVARRAVAAATADGLSVTGACLAVPGPVQAPAGPLRVAPNLGWRDLDVLGPLRREPVLAGLPLTVANEADLGALAELAAGTAGPTFLRVSGEVGIGAGVVVDGRLVRGARGSGGEIGHVPVRPDGPRCGCGARGCLEAYAGQEAVLRAGGVAVDPGTLLGAEASVAAVLERARAGDARMLRALDRAGWALGVALAGAVNLLDVGTVVVGGLHAALADWVLPPLRAELAERAVARAWGGPTVLVSSLGPDAAVRGAARSVLDAVLADPAAHLARPA